MFIQSLPDMPAFSLYKLKNFCVFSANFPISCGTFSNISFNFSRFLY